MKLPVFDTKGLNTFENVSNLVHTAALVHDTIRAALILPFAFYHEPLS